MGLKKPYNGAFQDVESVNKPYNGAWQECEAVFKPKNGAWEEVWSAIKELVELNNSLGKGFLDISDEGTKFYYTKDDDISGSGTIIFYVDGSWTDPTISFDYEGGMYRTNAGETTWYTSSGGSISFYGRTAGGSESIIEIVPRVGVDASGSLDEVDGWNETGNYIGTIEGTFDRIGLSIHVTGYTSATTYYNAYIEMIVSNLLLDGKRTVFPASSEFDYT